GSKFHAEELDLEHHVSERFVRTRINPSLQKAAKAAKRRKQRLQLFGFHTSDLRRRNLRIARSGQHDQLGSLRGKRTL
ncbi:hypothetical protein, partial [Paraburkholderia sp. SIMBA_030]|uniref:hypothetical protein n=1 Tax=Paraburkholderia sp. SIMBA_030 TaxID=3085773 RepID=UPI0039789925